MTAPSVRFAPSPTGYLHAGNVRTALINWLFARAEGGRFLLRIDDTDAVRSKQEYTEAIRDDLRWLGLEWDSEAHQSQRFEAYRAAAAALQEAQRLYACYETQEELDIQRKMQASRGLPPIYNRAALKLTEAQKKNYETEGRRPHWRFLLHDEEVAWDDLVRGPTHFRATHMSDPVLVREDGVPVYTLASVVDDGELGITHVIRGEDHVSNTAAQIQLYRALGFTVPRFAHLALLKTKEGELSKRLGGNEIRALRAAGMLPMAVNGYLARIGTSDSIEPVTAMQTLIDGFAWSKFGRAPAQYDAAELQKLNAKLLHRMDFAAARPHLPPQVDETFWRSVRGNISSLEEAGEWWDILHRHQNPTFSPEDLGFLRMACSLLPPEPWDSTTYDAWIAAVKSATGRKGKELFMPLRRALTGKDQGPELKALLPLLGRERAMPRLFGVEVHDYPPL